MVRKVGIWRCDDYWLRWLHRVIHFLVVKLEEVLQLIMTQSRI